MGSLHADATLAEVHGLSRAQHQRLSRSIAARQRALEADIHAFVAAKQRELAQYEHEYRSTTADDGSGQDALQTPRDDTREAPRAEPQKETSPQSHAEASSTSTPSTTPPPPPPPEAPPPERRPKHTRVHKREKELFGLVTPIFLPLLDAGEATTPPPPPPKDRRKRRSEHAAEDFDRASAELNHSFLASKDADPAGEPRKLKSRSCEMLAVEPVRHDPPSRLESAKKKSKRPVIKKSSLRSSSDGGRRKRVSLVVDDQIVLPADLVPEPTPPSPSDTAVSSPSTSTTSVDEAIDPRLLSPSAQHDHHDPVHHHISMSTTAVHTGHTLPDSPLSTPPIPASPRSPRAAPLYELPATTTTSESQLDSTSPRTVVDVPAHASAAPIYASAPDRMGARDDEFSTYVGGIDGSGVDDLDQTGSLGYPSSLGASFMEQYMKHRPMSVRISAAEKAGLSQDEKDALVGRDASDDAPDVGVSRAEDVDDGMEVMGDMEGF